jgi:hypothetical protein
MKKQLLTALACFTLLAPAVTLHAATGGPDTYGYTWIDSNEPGGPVYNWIEIATPEGGSGTYRSGINCDDCHEANIPLGFSFPYYGTPMTTVSIGSNGVVYFENVYLGLSNSCMPGTPGYTMAQYNFIAHLWDDLAPNYQGGIYTQAFPNYFVIEYYNIVPCCATGDGDTWQVILFRNGNILMQYKELSNQGLQSDFTVGIQNNPTTGLQYKCDATGIPLASGRAILFSPPTFNCTSVSQNIFGSNPGFCPGGSLLLSAGPTSIAQSWSTGPVTPTISVNTAGAYSVVVLDTNGCTIRDTANVVAFTAPAANIGPDVTQCGSALLDAGVSGMNYAWSESSVTQTISVTASGMYSVIVTDLSTGCTDNDTVNVLINPLPLNSLGVDVTQCGGMVTLDAGNAGMNYLWDDASVLQTRTVSATGTYYVTVTDPMTSCSNSDTISVVINPVPAVTLGADIIMCGNMVTLDAGNTGLDYLWSDNSTNQTLMVMMSGNYSVDVTDPNTGCTGSDSIAVTLNPNPVVDLGPETAQCGGTVVLDAGNAGANFMWSDSSTTQTLTIDSSALVTVWVTDPMTSCWSYDTINVMINPLPVVSLGSDTILCGSSLVLDAGNQGMNYLWSDSSAAQTLTITSSGTYAVTVTDPNTLCSSTDVITITLNTLPTVTFTLAAGTICVDDANLTLTGGSPSGGVYSGTSVAAGSFDPSIGAGTYTITYTYTDSLGCSDNATQTVTVSACVGIEEQTTNAVRMYPNPANAALNIESSETENTVTIFNTVGELVFAQQFNSRMTVDFSTLADGVYVVHVNNAQGNHVQKITVQH